MANLYTWLTLAQAIKAMQGRLANVTFWTPQEITYYLQEALRAWNSLTETWNVDYVFQVPEVAGFGDGGFGDGGFGGGGSGPLLTWYDISSYSRSPRVRTLTDSYIYTGMQYALLEPPTGAGVWAGTTQFSLADLQYALLRRRDEVIQISGCNVGLLNPVASTPNVRRAFLPDGVLSPQRIRFLPASGFGNPITLTREDEQAFDYFEALHLQEDNPVSSWSVVAEPPLAFDVDEGPNVAGTYEVLALQAGAQFNPPFSTLLGIPDDFSFVPKIGALSDLLNREKEATDRLRAEYYAQRYQDWLTWMRKGNWLLNARINGIPVDTPSLSEQDQYDPEWQINPNASPAIVTAATDLIAVCPVTNCSVGLTVLGNAPVPPVSGDLIQCSRDVFDQILNYAQFLAVQKQGGETFQSALTLEKQFLDAAKETNSRLAKLGIFSDVLRTQGLRQDEEVAR